MNKITLTAIAAALAFSAPVFADDAHHPEKAAEAKSAPVQPAPQVRKMQDNVKRMQAQLERIAKAKTGEEQQKAMAEHMQTMQENMSMARGMQGGMMPCPMMEGGMGMMGGGATGTPERMQQMEKRMDMMQMMMEQMMRRQEGAPMAPAPMK